MGAFKFWSTVDSERPESYREIAILSLFALLSVFLVFSAKAQEVPVLERKVTIFAQNERIDLLLKRISQEAGCVFSYSSSAIDVSKTVSGNFSNRPLREVLEVIFEGEVEIKQKGVYVILAPKPVSPKEVVIS